MTNFIPIFPLSITVFPGEELNLHIFEPRYKELITDCYGEQKAFGIPSVIDNHISDFGCTVTVTEIVNVYEDGKMDVKTKGVSIFNIIEKIIHLPDKQYMGAIVHYPNNSYTPPKKEMISQLLSDMRILHQHIGAEKNLKKPDEALTSYDIAHHVGMQLHEEYAFLQLLQEDQRQEYIRRHLKKVLSVINELDQLKEKIKLNGHFKFLKGL